MEITRIERAGYTSSAASDTEQLTEQRRVAAAVRQLNGAGIFGTINALTFARDTESHRLVVRIINRETREIVQELPPEYILRMSQQSGRF
ncbi:MAG: flagellar protein FlaG [Acidobacteria bacterium]|nr:flagellar protein FlaG [Acidobacteriota bacterium]